MRNLTKSLFILGILGMSLWLAGCSVFSPPPEFKGALYGEPAPPPSFSLEATNGETFTLRDQRDKVTLLFFGYTQCPDVCPATLGTIKTAFGQMKPADREQVQLVFISVDPQRDTLEVMRGYLARFNAGYIGVAPDEVQLEKMLADYGGFAEAETQEEDSSYLVTHTGLTYVIDKSGNLRLGFFTGMDPADIAHDLSILAEE
jgi:protein SCO1/2